MKVRTELQRHASDRQWGPLVDRDMLAAIVTAEMDRIGKLEFCRRAGIDLARLNRLLHSEHPRLYVADRLLTRGMGRPDLVGLVCPDFVESSAGAASSRRGRTPRRRDG